jgi:hypothetical protein
MTGRKFHMRTEASAHTVEQDAFPTCIANPLPRVHATAIGQIYVAGRCTITIKLPTGIARLLNKAAR